MNIVYNSNDFIIEYPKNLDGTRLNFVLKGASLSTIVEIEASFY